MIARKMGLQFGSRARDRLADVVLKYSFPARFQYSTLVFSSTLMISSIHHTDIQVPYIMQ
jgi:hypothetical protein